MKRFYLVGFALLLGFDSFAQIAFKYAGTSALPVEASPAWLLRLVSEPWVYGAILGYLGAFFTWMHLLRRVPVGPAFAASHLEVVSVMLLSIWLFNEPLTVTKVVGAAAILAGIVCLGLAETEMAEAVDSG